MLKKRYSPICADKKDISGEIQIAYIGTNRELYLACLYAWTAQQQRQLLTKPGLAYASDATRRWT
jgi:hypothetical protein